MAENAQEQKEETPRAWFAVTSLSGESVQLEEALDGKVSDLAVSYLDITGKQMPAGTILELSCGCDKLDLTKPLAELNPAEVLTAIVVRDTRPDVLLEVAGTSHLYTKVLEEICSTDAGVAFPVKLALPCILDVLDEMAGEAVKVPDVERRDGPSELEFSGKEGVKVAPSLDLQPILTAAGSETIPKISLRIGVNSDAYNQGLGIAVARPSTSEDKARMLVQYIYNGLGLQNKIENAIAVKFHPGMGGGQIRVEGHGGFGNSSMGFTPQNWSQSKKLHVFVLELGADGNNVIRVHGTEEGETWEKSFSNPMFDGRQIPEVRAWLDLGALKGRPGLHVSRPEWTLHKD